MKLYIASSFKNLHAVQMLRDILEAEGHTVSDWTKLAPPLPEGMPLEQRQAALDADARGDIFEFCSNACAGAGGVDLVVYLGPAGQDAACEIGMAFVSGTPILGLAGPLEAPGLILNRCVTKWVKDARSLLQMVEDYNPIAA